MLVGAFVMAANRIKPIRKTVLGDARGDHARGIFRIPTSIVRRSIRPKTSTRGLQLLRRRFARPMGAASGLSGRQVVLGHGRKQGCPIDRAEECVGRAKRVSPRGQQPRSLIDDENPAPGTFCFRRQFLERGDVVFGTKIGRNYCDIAMPLSVVAAGEQRGSNAVLQSEQRPQLRNPFLVICDDINKHRKKSLRGGVLYKIERKHLVAAPHVDRITADLAVDAIFDPVFGFGLGLLINRFAFASENRLHSSVSLRVSRIAFFGFVALGFRNSTPI